jgi:hypothetical protein
MKTTDILKKIEEVNNLFKNGKLTLLRKEQRTATLKRLLKRITNN